MDQTNIQQTLDDDDVPLSEIQSVPIRQIPKADLEIGKVYPAFFHEREEGKSFYMTRNIDAERHEILECKALTDFEGTEKLIYRTVFTVIFIIFGYRHRVLSITRSQKDRKGRTWSWLYWSIPRSTLPGRSH